MQGSGTFSVEAAVNTLVPRDGHVLVLINGAYGKRMAKLTEMMGRKLSHVRDRRRRSHDRGTTSSGCSTPDPSITHVGLIHCETSTGILNPLPEIAAVVAAPRRSLIVDAMSSFGAIADRRAHDAVRRARSRRRASASKARRAWGSCSCARQRARAMRRQLDVARARPARPVDVHGEDHAVALHAADARRRRARRRARPVRRRKAGQPARLARYAANCETLVAGMAELGSASFLDPTIQAPIIVTFHAPADPAYAFKEFYDRVRDKGFILYPGKLTQVETFRVGCIGAIGPRRDAPGGQRHPRHAGRNGDRASGVRGSSDARQRDVGVKKPICGWAPSR